MIPVPVTQLPPGSGGQENVQDNAGDEREDERDETADSNKGIDGNAFHGRPSCFFTMGAVINVPEQDPHTPGPSGITDSMLPYRIPPGK
ncbi:hypothetical protein [Methanoregula formicica]|uniref:hypothetical protein n=1 Tax=Methanoregula formicica TaxID=882104 RepID=UPI00130DF4EB|nr:hypothetical protein [Methanoregula formicica]